MRHILTGVSIIAAAIAMVGATPSVAQEAAPPPEAAPITPIPYAALNPGEPGGDRLESPRRIAAAIVAQDNPSPKLIVDVGSFTGEFLEAFMEQFPNAHGQWTEPVPGNRNNAHRRFARFGNRLDYVIGCPSRDISQGCVPKGVDVMLTSWLTIHQNLAGIQKFYREAYAMLPSGGWLSNIDHVSLAGTPWEKRFQGARKQATGEGLMSLTEGPPVHHADYVTPTLADQLAALKAAGFDDVQVVWSRLNTVLLMARKR